MNAIETLHLTKRYGNLCALDDLNLSVLQGELFGLLGVNGAGKTTAIKLLSCLSTPTEGDALLQKYSICTQANEVKKIIGVSPQQTAVAPLLTVRENLVLLCGVYGMDKEKTKETVETLVRDFSLQSVLSRKAGKLSGGWQRRLSIALALVADPAVLFLDEPTLGLDVLARAELWEVIRALKGKTTIVLTTHYMEEAQALCDRVAILKDGKLLGTATVEEWKAKTQTQSLEQAFVKTIQSAKEGEQ